MKMKLTSGRSPKRWLSFGILIGLFLIGAPLASAQGKKSAEAEPVDISIEKPGIGYDLTGTWELTITPDDGSPSFLGFYSFGAEGNASFSSAGPPIPGLGNPGYGVWKKLRLNRYAATIRMISYNTGFQFDGVAIRT